MECFICGIKGERATLFSAIIREGVVPICEDCSIKENIPVIKRVGQIREAERNKTVYERLSIMAGLDPVGHKEKIKREENIGLRRELRKPVEKKNLSFPNLKQIKPQFEEGLIRNYHWTIFNARRAMKLTQKQLADEIGEPEASVKLVERGILPDNYVPFVRKLQTYLGIILFNAQIKRDFNLTREEQKTGNFLTSSSSRNGSQTKETPRENVEEKFAKTNFPRKLQTSHEEHFENSSKKEENRNYSNFSEEKTEEPKVPYWRRLGFLNRKQENKEDEKLVQGENENKKNENSGEMRMLTQEEIDRITFSESKED